MREQVIGARGTKSATVANRRSVPAAAAQRPTARRKLERGKAHSTWSKVREVLPLIAKVALALVVAVFIMMSYRAAAAASFFELRRVDVSSTTRVSADDVRATVRRAAASSNVWRCDLEAISKELERLPFVRAAVVSRVLPSDLRVRIIERTPLVAVRNSAGRFLWVDEDAVVLGTLSPADPVPSFFLRGWDEANTDAARGENRERIEKFRQMSAEWEERNLTQRISEVNLTDVRDVRVQLAGDDAQIDVRLGRENFGKRLARALKELDNARGTLGGKAITYLDATLDGRTIIGLSSGASQVAVANSGGDEIQTPVVAPSKSEARRSETRPETRNEARRADERKRARNNSDGKPRNERGARRADEQRSGQRPVERRDDARKINSQERPRRVRG
ncbi:MAG: FtsQ-type POTRA domain-containing protein [Pyrinomonadaceae bacterium]|nr:FtsQ-type POTRA domain-containing protein [Pyrinomonadaceae bacterium]